MPHARDPDHPRDARSPLLGDLAPDAGVHERFLALAALVRSLHATYKERPDERLYGQIRNLRTRLDLIRWMQIFGIASLLLCVSACP